MAPQTFTERMTPLDLLMPRTYICALLAFETTSKIPDIHSNLQNGLDTLATAIPWLRGKVFPTTPDEEEKPGLEIRWTADDTAPRLVDKGSIGVSYGKLATEGFQPVSIPQKVWPVPAMIDEALFEAGAPVLATSLFRYGDDSGVGLCICAHHNAVDGAGFADIVRLLAQSTANPGLPLSVSPSSVLHRNSRLREAISSELNLSSSKSINELFALHPAYSRAPPALPTEFPQSTSSVLSISMSRVEELKRVIGQHATRVPSTNTAVCALVWSAITRARLQRNPSFKNEKVKLMTAVNGRKRINENFSTSFGPYLANVVLYGRSEPSLDDAIAAKGEGSKSLEAICAAIDHSQSADCIDADSIAQVYSLASQVDDYRTIFPGWDLFGSRDLCITSWAGLDVYHDFGGKLGKPGYVRIPYAEADGVVLVLPRRRVGGQVESADDVVDVNIMLRRDDMEVLKEDGLWKK